MDTYVKSESAVFYTTRQKWGEFSNFHTSTSIQVGILRFPTAEHLYQVCKFSDPDIQFLLNSQPTPKACKDLSRIRTKGVRPDWVHVRVPIMAWVVSLKVAQHESVRKLLLSTGEAPIVEKSNYDDFWGCRDKGDMLVGENTLGKILMGVRSRLRQGPLGEVRPPKVPNLRLMSHDLTRDRV